jgi:uncharacterized protein (DUF3820 family)
MASLEELRKWFAGESVTGLPSINKIEDESIITLPPPPTPKSKNSRKSNLVKALEKKKALDKKKIKTRAEFVSGKYIVSKDGDDVMLEFGKHKGRMLSDVANTEPSYLKWMLKEKFPEDLKDVCEYLLKKLGIPIKRMI